jgi:CDP-glycerol glycerophosphotransferase (TagB/SpsB family)
MENAFESQKPAAVVVWDDAVSFEKAAVLLAKKRGIPTVAIQHGLIIWGGRVKNWVSGYLPIYADFFAVWGPKMKSFLVKKGADAKKIVVTGCPRFDKLVGRNTPDTDFLRKIGCENKEIIFFASQRPIQEIDSYGIAREIIKAMPNFKDKQLIIKTHPLEEAGPYLKMAKEMNSNAIIMTGHLYDLLRACSVLITHSSTVGLEAMILKKPVIVFAKRSGGFSLYDSTDAIFRVENSEELSNALESIFSRCNERKMQQRIGRFVYDMAYVQDGKATKRVTQLIKKIVECRGDVKA